MGKISKYDAAAALEAIKLFRETLEELLHKHDDAELARVFVAGDAHAADLMQALAERAKDGVD